MPEIIVSLLCGLLFVYAHKVSGAISTFYSNYPIVRLLPQKQYQLNSIYIRIGAAVLFIAAILHLLM